MGSKELGKLLAFALVVLIVLFFVTGNTPSLQAESDLPAYLPLIANNDPAVVRSHNSFFGPEIENGFFAFVAENTPSDQSCSWVVGVRQDNFSGNVRVPACLTMESNRSWTMTLWLNPIYAASELGGADHGAFFVSGRGQIVVDYTGNHREVEVQNLAVGVGLRPNDIVQISFYPAYGSTLYVRWGPDPDNMAEYGPGGNVSSNRSGVRWLTNEVPSGSGWFSTRSFEYERDHPDEDCAWSILFKEVVFEQGKHVPMPFCAQWEMQQDNPSNSISGYFAFWAKAGPNYQDSLPSLSEPGLVAGKLALWIGMEAHVLVRFNQGGQTIEQQFDALGSSRGISFVPGDAPVYVEITVPRVGGEALIRWGPNYAPWCAEFGPAGTLVGSSCPYPN